MNPADTSPAPRAQSSEAAGARQAPLALWRVAQVLLGVLHTLFGGPEDVAARHTLTGKAHAFMAGWLRCAEALVRRLIALEAAFYPKPNTRPLLKPRRAHHPKLMGFDADKPEDWRVSLRCFASVTLRQAQGDEEGHDSVSLTPDLIRGKAKRLSRRKDPWHQMHWKPVSFRSAWPLAERYEALLRAFNDPAPYARRLSRRLHATPHRLVEALRAPPEAVHRVDQFEGLGERARAAWRAHFSSG